MDLADLKARVDRARAEMEAPLSPDQDSKPILPLTEYLRDDDWGVLWEAVREVRRRYPAIFNLFQEGVLAQTLVFVLADLDGEPDLAGLAERMREISANDGPWLVSTSLVNLHMSEPALMICDGVALQRALSSRDPDDEEYNREVEARLTVLDDLGDYLSPPLRWIDSGDGIHPLDTSRSAALVTVEPGSLALAHGRARAKALHALAIWSILSPPGDFELLPDIGIQCPQPSLFIEQPSKLFEPGTPITHSRQRAGRLVHRSPYPLPDVELLRIPFDAIDLVRERRSAQALLSASWAYFQAARGSRSLLSERLRHLLVAVETLGEPAPGKEMRWSRWRRIRDRSEVHEALKVRGHSCEEIKRAEKRLKQARNIATHGADAALIDLGFPPGEQRELLHGSMMPTDDLGFAALSADLSTLLYAVRLVLNASLREAAASDWDDEEFDRQFSG
jgi:hypothetical protein